MQTVLVSLQNAQVPSANGQLCAPFNLQLMAGQGLAIAGTDEVLKSALAQAIAGTMPIQAGTRTLARIPQQGSANEAASRPPFVLLVSARHHFKNLSNTTDFYYQQRFNSSDSDNSLTVHQYLQSKLPQHSANGQVLLQQTIAQFGLQPLLNEGVIKLSNGETRRVLIAAALLMQPDLLVLQHPLAGLDVQSREEITALINQLLQKGITLVVVCNQAEVPMGITTVCVANTGEAPYLVPRQQLAAPPADRAIPTTNIALVQQLATAHPLPLFTTVVGMKNVSISYDGKLILDNINWTIQQGERWALRGPNGAGKSTLLSLITGDNPQAFANNITLFDRRKGSGETIWEIKQKIGFFSTELYQYFPLETTAVHAVESGLYDTIGLFKRSSPTSTQQALQCMQLLQVAHLANIPLYKLAPTQQRLCLLARALVKWPVLLILDEPCHGFTLTEREYFKTLINQICQHRNTTLIYVSHYAEEIPTCVNRFFTLSHGRQVG